MTQAKKERILTAVCLTVALILITLQPGCSLMIGSFPGIQGVQAPQPTPTPKPTPTPTPTP